LHNKVSTAEEKENFMSTEENKTLMRHFYEEVFNQKNVAAIDDFIAPTFVNHSASQLGLTAGDLEHVTQFVSMVMQVFPDLHYTVEDLVAEGDKVVARLTISGTQQGAFMGIPSTGKHATISDIEIFRITGGKAVETWVQVDFLGLLQQLGAIPPMR
jgi:steroid delta-isomerase-like uncharacterized protein